LVDKSTVADDVADYCDLFGSTMKPT
jgi:hypothetical protein